MRTIELVNDLATLEYIDEVSLPTHELFEDTFTPACFPGDSHGSVEEAVQEKTDLHLCWRYSHICQSIHQTRSLLHKGRCPGSRHWWTYMATPTWWAYIATPPVIYNSTPGLTSNCQISERYRGVTKVSLGSLPPHIFAVAGASFQTLFRERKDQVRG